MSGRVGVRLRTMTVRSWLMLAFGGLLGGVAALVYSVFPDRFETEALKLLGEEAQLRASVAAHSVQSALVFKDDESAEEVVEALFQDPGLLRAEIRDADGRVVAGRSRPGGPAGSVAGEARVAFSGRELGRVRLELSAARASAHVAGLRRTAARVSALIALFGLLAVALVAHRIATSLARVAEAAHRIGEGDEDGRAPDSGLLEVSRLSRAFNAMVDQLQEVRHEAERSRERIQTILESLPGIVEVYGADGSRLFTPTMSVHTPEVSRLPEDALETVRAALETGALAESEFTVRSPGKPVHCVHLAVSPIRLGDGTVMGAVAYGTDITDLREAQAALAERDEQLLRAQKMEALGRLAGGVAHDFNNALTAIQGHAELVLEDLDQAEQIAFVRESLDQILGGARHASSITRRLLAFGRRQILQPEELDLREAMIQLSQFVRPMLGENVLLEQELGDHVCHVTLDPGQFEQAMINLCINARDAMQPSGGTLRLSLEQARVGPAETLRRPELKAGTWEVVVVSDTGCGMNRETQAHLFEPFFTTKDGGKGSGLGLAMVHGFVTQTGGFITLDSAPGAGTEFRVHLPSRSVWEEAPSAVARRVASV